jgi:opacity protein-like surface antigen
MRQKKRISKLFFLTTLLFSSASFAHIKPVVTLSLGNDHVNFDNPNTTVPFLAISNIYAGNNTRDNQLFGGIFLGAQKAFRRNWFWQFGFGYYDNADYQVSGQVYQDSDPSMNNLGYTYGINSNRVLAETKILATLKNIFHPYVDGGVGAAFNASSSYSEFDISDGSGFPMSQPFASKTTTNFAYMIGFGVDTDLTKLLRVGLGYRFVDLGDASLGLSPLQSGTAVIKNNHITSNEALIQISLIC